MRRPLAVLLALLVAAPSGAVTIKTAAPISYRVAVAGGDVGAAGRFLSDPAALSWYAKNRPADLGPMLQSAHQALDVRSVAATYADDPAALRRAIGSRSDIQMYAEPALLLKAVASDEAAAPAAPAFAAAALEWDSLTPSQRGALERMGTAPAAWSALSFPQRMDAVRGLYEEAWSRYAHSLTPGAPEYLAALEGILNHGGSFLKPASEAALREHRERVRALHERMARAKARVDALTDPVLAQELASAASAPDVERAQEALDRLFAGAAARAAPEDDPETTVIRPAAAPVRRPATAAELEQIAAHLPALMRRLAKGTEAGAMLEALDAGETPTRVAIARPTTGALAHYEPSIDLVVLDSRHVEAYLAWKGLTVQTLLDDPRALTGLAAVFLPIYVHETTHRRQTLASDRKNITRNARGHLYSQADEDEAFMAQALVARRLLQHQRLAAWLTQAQAVAGLEAIVGSWRVGYASPAEIAAMVRRNYVTTAGEHAARVRAVNLARIETVNLAPYRPAAVAELARRRRLPAVERAALARLPMPETRSIAGMPTHALRDLARRGDANDHEGLRRYYGYLSGLEHARAGLASILAP